MSDQFEYDVFLSHSSADKPIVKKLAERLTADDFKVWFDGESIREGNDWIEKIEEGLAKSRKMVVCASKAALESDWVKAEFRTVLRNDPVNRSMRLLPLRLEECDVEGLLGNLQRVDWFANNDEAYKKLTRFLRPSPFDAVLGDGSTTRVQNLPSPRNPYFTGREEILDRLHASFLDPQSKAVSLSQAIKGLGGIGKTQIALEYAHRCYEYDNQTILWINAETDASITTSYTEIAQMLRLPEKSAKETDVIVKAVMEWMQASGNWLAVYDNVEDPVVVGEFVPSVPRGRFLFTTRKSTLGSLAASLEITTMDKSEALKFLLKRACIQKPNDEQEAKSKDICEKLGYLPLAINQAGAYLEKTGCTLAEYLEALDGKGLELLRNEKYKDDKYQHTVATVWETSMEKVRADSPEAEDLLKLFSFFAPDDIPLDMVKAGKESFHETLKATVEDVDAYNQAVGALKQYSLVSRSREDNSISLHRLVQAVVRDGMDQAEKLKWLACGTSCLNRSLHSVKDIKNWPVYERMVPHVAALKRLADETGFESEGYGRLLHQAGYYLKQRARYSEAESMYKRALEIGKKTLGPNHSDVATHLNNLAGLYRAQGKYGEAEPMRKRALKIDEKVYGPDHPEVATDLNNLALLYQNQGRYDEAELMYKRALEIGEKTLGPDHPKVAIRLNNLAELYRAQGKYGEAEPMFKRALEIREEVLGSDHPDTAVSLSNLAGLYYSQGRYDEAEPMYKRALGIDEKTHGPDHPSVARDIHNLGTLLYAKGDKNEGIAMVQRAYGIFSKVLGPDHPNTQTVREFLVQWNALPEGEE